MSLPVIEKFIALPRASRFANLFAPAIVDLFAGAGGWSIGAEQAFVDGGYADKYVDLMVNHWDVAVGVHQKNHPMTEHLHASVWEVDPLDVLPGRRIAYLHASPDCTHFSKARGSKPKKKEIRGLAWVVVDWAEKRRPDVITLENVEEFTTWGPLGDDGQPCPRRRGETFEEWKDALKALGYVVEHRELRACDYGAPTTRKRLFVVARCDGRAIVWPEKTHGKVDNAAGGSASLVEAATNAKAPSHSETWPATAVGHRDERRSLLLSRDRGREANHGHARDGESTRRKTSYLKPFRTAAECIDWSIPMLSIFATPAEAKKFSKLHGGGVPRRPLKPKTLERIARGLVKFVLEAKRPYIVNIENATWDASGVRGVDQPINTVTATPKGGKHAVVDATLSPCIVHVAHGDEANGKARWGNSSHSVDEPIGTVTGSKDYAVAAATIAPYTVPNLGERDGQAPRCGPIDAPLPTVTAAGTGANLVAATLQTLNHAGPEHRGQSPNEPLHTVTSARDARACVAALLTKHFGGVVGKAIDTPADTITGTDHHAVTVAYLNKHRGQSPGTPADAPIDTITAGPGGHVAGAPHAMGVSCAYLSHMYGTNKGERGDLNEPAPTVTGTSNHATLVAAFLSTFYGNTKDGNRIDEPSPTVVSKDRIQLVTVTIDGQTYVVTDIAMRMLRPRELARCQGFSDDYVIEQTADGKPVTKADQVKLVGNSVPPAFARAIVRANVVDQGVLEEQAELIGGAA